MFSNCVSPESVFTCFLDNNLYIKLRRIIMTVTLLLCNWIHTKTVGVNVRIFQDIGQCASDMIERSNSKEKNEVVLRKTLYFYAIIFNYLKLNACQII